MVKTTIILEDELYKKLVREALEKYGSTRKLSLLINEKLKKSERISTPEPKRRTTLKLGRRLSPKEIDELIERGLEESV
ncbi:MAG: hypothetical protein ACP5KW_11980 [Thermoproteota archaeon]|jgi:hypothetical protein